MVKRCGRRIRISLSAFVLAFLQVGVLRAHDPFPGHEAQWWGFSTADPIRFTSAPLDLGQFLGVAHGEWRTSFSISYFNLWFGSWHTAVIHREFGLQGQPLEPWELRTLERRHPEDAIFRLDAEGLQANMTVATGISSGLTLVIDLPWIEVGAPRWDAISEDFHTLFGLRTGDRVDIARSQTLIYIRGKDRDRAIEAWDELDGSGPGDLRFTLNGSLGEGLGGRHRWAISVVAPTGKKGSLRGSGGWDTSIGWCGTWSWGRSRLRGAVGYSHLDSKGSFLGVERTDTFNGMVVWLHPQGESNTLAVGLSLLASPISGFTDAEPGDPSMVLELGWGTALSQGSRLEVGLSENITGQGTAPDFALHCRVTMNGGD